MIQLKVYNDTTKTEQYWLDLYDTEPIKLTLSIEDITSTDATSTFSKTFKVPGTRKNAEFFKNSFDVDGILYDVTTKKPAEILVDGAEFKQGHIRLQSIILNTELDRYDYELLFLGETRDFSSIIGDKGLCQLELSDLIGGANGAALSAESLVQSWQAFPESASLTAGLHNGNIIYPLVDHGNTYTDAGVAEQTKISVDADSGHAAIFTMDDHPLFIDRMKPMIRAKRIVDQIFADAGYTYTSEFFESEKFHQIYISAWGNEASVTIASAGGTDSANCASGDNLTGFQYAEEYLNWNQNVIDPNGNVVPLTFGATGYQVPITGNYRFRMSAYYEGSDENSDGSTYYVDGRVELWNATDNQPVLDNAGNPVVSNYGNGFQLTRTSPVIAFPNPSVAIGDKLTFKIGTQYGIYQSNVTNVSFAVLEAPGEFNPATGLECTYKQIDFIKDLLTAFRLVLAPDPNDPKNFIIEPWQTYINSGNLYDWSHKLVENKDVVLEPVFFSQSDVIDFSFQPGGDYTNVYHQQAYEEPYGWLQFSSNNELLQGKRDVKLIGIAPTELVPIEGTDPNVLVPIPQIHTHSSEDTGLQHRPVKAKTRMLFYNGLQPFISDPSGGNHGADPNTWYLNGANTPARTTYPLVSPYETWPIQPGTLNLNWYNDIQYWGLIPVENPLYPGTPGEPEFIYPYNEEGNTLYDDYWSRYISSLYNKYSRRLTAYFVLNNIDLNEFSFDDTIFINGTYYRPERIIDVEVGAYTEVKAQLLTANDFRPPINLNRDLEVISVTPFGSPCAFGLGSIEVVTNGTPPFTWTLSNGQSGAAETGSAPGNAPYTFTIENVPVGTYTLTINDALGRSYETQVIIPTSEAGPVEATQTVTDATDCFTCNGEVLVIPGGGGYTILWNDGNTSWMRTDLCPNQQYTYQVFNSLGCESAVYLVIAGCPTPTGTVWNFAKNLNCQALSTEFIKVYIPQGTTPSTDDIVSLEPINPEARGYDGCYSPVNETTGEAEAVATAYWMSCESCQGEGGKTSWKVQSCTQPKDPLHPNATRYIYANTGVQPGDVVYDTTVDEYGPCYTVIGPEYYEPANMVITGIIYDTCESCASTEDKNYLIEECDTLTQYNAFKTYTFNVGDVVQFTIDANPTEIKCGTIISDLFPSGNSDATLYGPTARICGDDLHCDQPLDDICVTNFGASMAPCIGGTVDEYMEGYVNLSGVVSQDTTFTLIVGWLEGPNGNCDNPQYFQILNVTVEAGQSDGLLTCPYAPFISSSGATICDVSLFDSPYPEC